MDKQIAKILMKEFSPEQLLEFAEQFKVETETSLQTFLQKLAKKIHSAYIVQQMPNKDPFELEKLPLEVLVLVLEEIKDWRELSKTCQTNKQILQLCNSIPSLQNLLTYGPRRERYEQYFRDQVRETISKTTLEEDPNALQVYGQHIGQPMSTPDDFINYYSKNGKWNEIIRVTNEIEPNVPTNTANALADLSLVTILLVPIWLSDPDAETMVVYAEPVIDTRAASTALDDPLIGILGLTRDPESLDPPYSQPYLSIPKTPKFTQPQIRWDFADFEYSFRQKHNRNPTPEEMEPLWDSLHKVEAYYGIEKKS